MTPKLDAVDLLPMSLAPIAQWHECGGQGLAKCRDLILHARAKLLIVVATDDSISFELAKLLHENLLADSDHEASESAEAAGPTRKMEKDERLPLTANNRQRNVEAANVDILGHASLDKYQCYRAIRMMLERRQASSALTLR